MSSSDGRLGVAIVGLGGAVATTAVAGAAEIVHLDLPEAPHRGYESAAELFGPVKDTVDIPLDLDADLVLVPQALGDHVDHHHVVRAAGDRWTHAYADHPYALRLLDPPGDPGPVTPDVATKLGACAAYTTQLGFQFGGEAQMRTVLGTAPERFLSRDGGTGSPSSGPTSRRSSAVAG